jgi:hypothetical protein
VLDVVTPFGWAVLFEVFKLVGHGVALVKGLTALFQKSRALFEGHRFFGGGRFQFLEKRDRVILCLVKIWHRVPAEYQK